MHGIDCRPLLLGLIRLLQCPHGISIRRIIGLLLHALRHGKGQFLQHLFLLRIPLFHGIGKIPVLRQQFRTHLQFIDIVALCLYQQMAQICLSVVRIVVQDTLRIFLRLAPVTILAEVEHTGLEIVQVRLAGRRCRCLLRYRLLFIAAAQKFLDAADQVLDKAQLVHIHRLQVCEFFRQIVGIHIPVSWDQSTLTDTVLFLFILDQRQITVPFISNPGRFKVFFLRTEHDHNSRRLQCRKDIRLVIHAQLIFQRNGCIEYLKTFRRQAVIQFVCQRRIRCTFSVFAGFLVADEHIKRLLVACDIQKGFLDTVDLACFRLIYCLLLVIGIL